MNFTKSLRSNRFDPVTIGPIEQLGSKDPKTIGTIGKDQRKAQISKREVDAIDQALEDTADVRNEKHPSTGQPMRPYYAKKCRELGVSRYLGLASEARHHYTTTPKQYFAFLLRITNN